MTRKHYIDLAETLRIAKWRMKRIGEVEPVAIQTWEFIRDSIADTCKRDNPRFDRERFYAACEPHD